MAMFRKSATLVALLVCLIMTGPAFAQAQRWEVLAQPGGYRVARVVSQGLASGIGLTCERNVPVIAVNLLRAPPRNPAAVIITVDGTPFRMALVRNLNTNVWVAGVRDRRLLDMMVAGNSAQIAVEGAAYGSASLAGAGSAIGTALASCYRPQAVVASTPAATAAPAAMPASVGENQGCPSLAPVQRWSTANVENFMDQNSVFCGDFTGDGAPDALAFVRFEMGNSAGHEVVLFQNAGGTLRFLRRVPELYGEAQRAAFSRGKVWVDMTVMQAGDARCCPTGKERVAIDVATGKHARVTGAPALAPSPPARGAVGAKGALSKIPMQLGYYVNDGETCRRPTTVTKFEPDGFWMISDEGAFKEKIAKVTDEGEGAYMLHFADVPPADPNDEVEPVSAAMVTPQGNGRILMQINGDGEMHYCNESEIPARFRK